MRNGLVGLVVAMMLAATMATAGCGSGGGTGATGGSSSTGGTVGIGGSSSSGGAGAGGASGGGSVTSLSGTKTLGALTTEEATQLCSDSHAYLGRVISRATMCKWNGLAYAVSSSAPTDTQLQANCTSKETSCLQTNPDIPSCGNLSPTCTATVAEYSTCITDEAAAYNRVVPGLASCATVTRADLAAVWAFMTDESLPASCTTELDNTCPGLDFPTPR